MSSNPVSMTAGGSAGASPSGPEHAYLVICEPSSNGALDEAGPQIDRLDFQFNPKELTLGKAADWKRQTVKGSNTPGAPQYQGPQPSKLTLELFFDASASQDGSVVTKVERLFKCCIPTRPSQQNEKASPPWVRLRWGQLTSFLAYVSNVQAKYTLFTAAGLPIRAVCTATLEELSGEPPKQNPTSGGLVPRRRHVVVEGDTLAGIAYREYGSAGLWRSVAQVNDIDDPRRLRAGTHLLLPAIDELNHSTDPEQTGSTLATHGTVARATR